jgi:hypothetical protein
MYDYQGIRRRTLSLPDTLSFLVESRRNVKGTLCHQG